MPRRRRPPLLIRLPVLIGLTMLAGAGISAWPAYKFVTKAERADGTYAGGVGRVAGKPATVFAHPRFRFVTADGAVVSFTARDGSKSYATGDTAPVYYDPVQPTDARLGSIREMWLGPLVLGGLGLVTMLAGAWVAARSRRRAALTPPI